jgi:hypothetical protein
MGVTYQLTEQSVSQDFDDQVKVEGIENRRALRFSVKWHVADRKTEVRRTS